MKKAIINDLTGLVINVVELDNTWAGAEDEWQPPNNHSVIDALDCQIGDTWDGETFISGYEAPFITSEVVLNQIDKALAAKLNEGILWAFNIGETQHPISLRPSMRETLSTFKQLLDSGHTNPHGGYLWSNGTELRKPDDGDLSDAAIDEICMFSGQWALAISRVSIQQKQLCAAMTLPELQAYDTSLIDWTIPWNALDHPDWTDNLVLKNP